MTPDPDEILAKMRQDTESDWFDRLTHDMAQKPLVPETQIEKFNPKAAAGVPDLSEPELAALRFLSRGLSVGDTAAALGKHHTTIADQLKLIRRKLRAKNTTHACCEAIRHGLIP
jgi:DNA-binding NarL/FixJ family response regulator